MRIIILLTFLLASIALEAQSITKVQNMGDRYRISAPIVPDPPVPFSAKRARISVTCMATFATTVSHVTVGEYVEFQMNGNQLVSSATEYYINGKWASKPNIPVCFYGLNPISECNKKM